MGDQLLPLPLTERSVHLCVDMQRIFSVEGPWPTPWMDRVLPVAAALANRYPDRTVFTRFISPRASRPDARHVPAILHALARCDPRGSRSLAAGVDAAARGAFPSRDGYRKTRYSAFAEPWLIEHLRQREADG